MHVVVVFIEAKREHAEALRAALTPYARKCLEEETGCHRFEVALDPLDPASFLLFEVYLDHASYLMHREMPHYAEFREMIDPWLASRRVLTYELLPEDEPGIQ
jgi:quinol monooxygenase YgiN